MISMPKCILVVDNDPDVLGSVDYSLQAAGYQVLTANSSKKASELLAREIIHLAIIDIRLEDNKRPEDFSGFSLARQLPDYIPCVIFTAYEDKENIRRALGEIKAKEILDKSTPDAALRLVDIVDNLFTRDVKVNFDLEIKGMPDVDGIANQIDVPVADQALSPSADDVRLVLQSMFYKADVLQVAHLLPPEPAVTLTQAGSVLVRARAHFEHGWGIPVVVKFGSREEISCEANNYEVIKPFLGWQRLPDLRGQAYSRQIGGLVYSLIGGDWESIRTFNEVFLSEETAVVTDLLRKFFEQTFGALFADARRDSIDLTATYTGQLGLKRERLQAAISSFHPEALTEPMMRFTGLKGPFRNPVLWALTEEPFRHFEVVSRQCLCHGDLHSRNILVDGIGNFWMIDFARSAESHVLRDFVELETDLKFNVLPVVDLTALLPFEQALLAPASLHNSMPVRSFSNNRLDHAYGVISALRGIAAKILNLDGDMREYYQALFIHTLNVMRLRHISPERKEYALLSAALICQRLDNWPEWEFESGASANQPTVITPPTEINAVVQKENTRGSSGEGQRLWLYRIIAASFFLLVGAVVVSVLLWAMQRFNATLPNLVLILAIIGVLIITLLTLMGSIPGDVAVKALVKIVSDIVNKTGEPSSDQTDVDK